MKRPCHHRLLLMLLASLLVVSLSGCELWYVSAARAAKKRKTQTGPIMGEIEQATDIDDPLGRQQGSIDQTADQLNDKADKVGDRVENVVGDL